jgi:hypothetical protein
VRKFLIAVRHVKHRGKVRKEGDEGGTSEGQNRRWNLAGITGP